MSRADDGHRPQALADLPDQADEERVGETDHFRPFGPRDPVREPPDLLRLAAGLAPQRGQGDLAEGLRGRHVRPPRRQTEEGAQIEDTIDPPWRVPEDLGSVLQVHIDATQEDRHPSARVGVVHHEGQVERSEHGVVPEVPQAEREGVVADAGAAVEVARARGEQEDLHLRGPRE
jgi:hypothetical protein